MSPSPADGRRRAQGGSPEAIGKEITRALVSVATNVVTREVRNQAMDKLEGKAKKALESILK
jgi:hypothetical protein